MNRAHHAGRPPDTGDPGLAAPAAAGARILGPGEWALLPGPAAAPGPDVRDALRALAAQAAPPGCGLVPVSAAALPWAGLVPAVLHYRRGRAVVYCDRGDICETAAPAVGAVAGCVLSGLVTPPGAPFPPELRVDLAGHDALPRALHPAACCARGPGIVITACRNLMSARLACALSSLGTAHLRILPSLSQPPPPRRARRHPAVTAPPGRQDPW